MLLSTHDLPTFFDPLHHELAETLAAMAGPLAAACAGNGSATDVGAHVASEMGRHGLYHWLVPDAPDGPRGGRVDVRALCLIRECLGYVSPLADAIFAVQGLGTFPIHLAGQTAAHAGLLAACCAGMSIGGFGLTEPEAGSDVASMQSIARPLDPTGDPDRYAIDGHKTLISNVGIAHHYVVFANANPGAGRKGITAFLVQRDAPGLTEEPIALNIDHPIGALHMQGCEATLLGEVGGGFRLAMQTLDTFRVTVGAAAVGMARRALDEALGHVERRVQFGRPLSEQQIVQSYLADMATELDASRLLVLRAASLKDAGQDRVTREAAMAKLYATEAAQRIIDRAVQLFGGRGVAAGEVVENLYRAIRPLRIYEGTSEIQRIIIARAMMTARRAP